MFFFCNFAVVDVKFTMLIAAGPYTTTDNILYEPLNDLITYLQKGTPPDVCVLVSIVCSWVW